MGAVEFFALFKSFPNFGLRLLHWGAAYKAACTSPRSISTHIRSALQTDAAQESTSSTHTINNHLNPQHQMHYHHETIVMVMVLVGCVCVCVC
ncbi:hypothetical protein FKM82_001275 [Ascaphus truei]